MKKNFLKIIFAMTMGVSLFSWKSIGANVNAEPVVTGTTITMTCDEEHPFESTATVTAGTSVKVKADGKTIEAVDVGESTVQVGDTTYTVNVSLPGGYNQIDYVSFPIGTSLNTGYVADDDCIDFQIVFHYEGCFVDRSIGWDNDCHVFSFRDDIFFLGNCAGGSEKAVKPNVSYRVLAESKTEFNLQVNNGYASFSMGDSSFSNLQISSPWHINPFVLGYEGTSAAGNFVGNIYDLRINVRGEQVCNFIPCIDESTNTIGFYDTQRDLFLSSNNPKKAFKYDKQLINISYTSNNYEIKPSNKILYLGAEANFADMNDNLVIDSGTILTGTVLDKSINVDEDNLNLTTIFGPMTSGNLYTMKMTKGLIEEEVGIIKTEGVAEMHLESDISYLAMSASKNVKGTGSMLFKDGSLEIASNINKIKTRGNHVYLGKKNSFSITLSKELRLIPDAPEQISKYNLIGLNSNDTTFLATQVGYSLWQQLTGKDDAVHYRMVNLWLNNQALGLYMLTEKVEINDNVVKITEPTMTKGTSMSSVSSGWTYTDETINSVLATGILNFRYCKDSTVESDGGFILEAGYYYNADSGNTCGFKTSRGCMWEIKEPECPSLSQVAKIAIYMQKAEDALFSTTGLNSEGKHYSELFDLDSIARDYLLHAITGETDFYVTSNYLYIDGNNDGLTTKLFGGPSWDYDSCAYGMDDFCYNSYPNDYGGPFRRKLLEKGDFVALMEQINKNIFKPILNDFIDSTNTESLTIYDLVNDYYTLRDADGLLWEKQNQGYNAQAIKDRFINRVAKWNVIWSDDTLQGVTISKTSNGVISSTSRGAETYQWYKVNSDKTSATLLAGQTDDELLVQEQGIYFVTVTGTALPGTSASTMTSNVIDLSIATVTFNMQGHGVQISSQSIAIGSLLNEPERPYESGYLFGGWYKESNFENKWDFAIDTVQDNITLHAKWTQGGTYFDGNVSISLKDNTWINFYTSIPEGEIDDYSFKYTLRGGSLNDVEDYLINKVNDKIRISVALLPYQLADDVVIYMYDNQNRVLCNSVTLSVRSYAAYALAHSSDENYKNALKALLNYGAAVQVWQGYHTNDLANSILNNDQNQQPGN